MDGRPKMKPRHAVIDLTFQVLQGIEDVFEMAYALQGRDRWIAMNQGIDGLRRVERERHAHSVRKRLAMLKHRRYVAVTKRGYVLTDSGKQLLAKKRIRNSPRLPDNRWLAVVFDFPEPSRSARNRFRGFIKTSGFARLQQSVWVTRQDAREALKERVLQMGFGDWVKIWLVEIA